MTMNGRTTIQGYPDMVDPEFSRPRASNASEIRTEASKDHQHTPRTRSKRKRYFFLVGLVVLFYLIPILVSNISRPVTAQDYTFGSENAVKGTTKNPTYKNIEDGSYEELIEGDQYTDTNFSGSSENIVTGTTGGGSFPSALTTDDATRRNYIEASSSASPYSLFINPTSDTQAQFDSIYPAAATRFYFRSTTPAEPKPNTQWSAPTPAFNALHWLTSTLGGGQDASGTIYACDMSTTIGASSQSITKSIAESSALHNGWAKAFISPSLSAQTISGTFSLIADYQEGAALQNMNPMIYIYVWKADDSGQRGNLYGTAAVPIVSTLEADTTIGTLQTFTFASYTLGSLAVSAGDRIVIEMAFYDANTKSTTYTHGFGLNGAAGTGYDSYIEFSMTIAFQTGDPYAATHFDKLDDAGTASTGDGSTTYIYTPTATDVDIFGMSDIAAPGAGYNIDVTIYCVHEEIVTGTNNLQAGIRIGTTNYQGITVDPTLNTWTNSSSSAWTTNPSTTNEWTTAEVNTLSTYLASSDATPAIYCTRLVLKIDVSFAALYALDAQITYSGVTSTSQTTGYAVYCQGYRNGDTENVKVQAWNYITTLWVDKATISTGSDADYDFSLTTQERDSGTNEVKLRLVDATDTDATQTTAYLDVLKVRRIEIGYALEVEMTASSVNQYGNEQLKIKGYTSAETFYVFVYNWTSSTYDTNKITVTATSNTMYTYNLITTHHRSGTQSVKIEFVDANAQASDTVQDILYLDLSVVSWVHSDPSITQYGAIPSTVNLGDSISFFAAYTDLDNEAPSYVRVHIDSTDYDMLQNETGDTTYFDSKTYYYSTTSLTGGLHDYFFRVKDANSIEVTTSSAQVTVNRAPTLTQDGVTPATGNNGDTFSFFVLYTDLDGNFPSYLKVRVDSTDYDLIENSSGDVDVTDGKAYYYSKGMSGGSHTYFFKTKDYLSSEVTTTSKDLDVNNGPTLSSFSRLPVDPVYINTQVTFSVVYTDIDGDLPSSIKWRETGISNLTMSESTPADTDVTDGKQYEISMYLSHALHTYDFGASDGMLWTSGGSDSITIQNRPPTIDNKIVDDHEYRNTYWEYDYAYTDLDGDNVLFEKSTNATFLSINSATGLIYGTTSDPVGWYSVTVWCNDSYSGSDSDSFILYVDNKAPVITNGPGTDPATYRNTAWYYDFDFTDGDSDSVAWQRTGESWLTIASDGNLSGTTPDTPGNYPFTIWCNDSYSGGDNYAFILHVDNRVPVIISSGNTTQQEATYLAYHVLANDDDGDSLSYALSTNATWAGLSGSWINGTASGVGWYEFTVWTNDSYSGSDSEHWHLTITPVYSNNPPYFTSTPNYSVANNSAYYYDANAVDPEEDPITYGLTTNCPNLEITPSTGVVSGTPNKAGDYYSNVTASDGINPPAYQNYTLHVTTTAPSFTNTPIETWQNGTSYSYDANASDLEGEDLVFGLEGNCTAFLSIIPSTGVITGAIPSMGWWYLNISVTDYTHMTWQNVSLTALNTKPSFTTSPVTSGQKGVPYYYNANAEDINNDAITFSLNEGAAWLFVDEITGEVEGTPTEYGVFNIELRAFDGIAYGWQNYTVTVPNAAPSFNSSPILEGEVGRKYFYQANATDPDDDQLSYFLDQAPPWLFVGEYTGLLEGTPTGAGSWDVHLKVFDGYSYVWQNWTILVTQPEGEIPDPFAPRNPATSPVPEVLSLEFLGFLLAISLSLVILSFALIKRSKERRRRKK
jgi:hypothetical protein